MKATRWSWIIALCASSCCSSLRVFGQADATEGAIARARKLEAAGEAIEATAVLAQEYSKRHDIRVLDAWIDLDRSRVKSLEAANTCRDVGAMALVCENPELASAVQMLNLVEKRVGPTAAGRDNGALPLMEQWLDGGCAATGTTPAAFRAAVGALDIAFLDDEIVRRRLQSYDVSGRSLLACTSVISATLRSDSEGDLDACVARKATARSLMEELKKSRATFVSYEFIAPRLFAVRKILLVPDKSGILWDTISEPAMKRAAELVGEVSREVRFANKDVKRLYLDTLSQLKQHAGKEPFKSLESQATVVGSSEGGPEQWEPK